MNRLKNRWKQKRPCPECRSQKIGLNDRRHGFGRFFLECENCHWCSGNAPTIGTAVWRWNRDGDKYFKRIMKHEY